MAEPLSLAHPPRPSYLFAIMGSSQNGNGKSAKLSAGRPCALTPKAQREICKALRAGNTYRVAAAFGGVSEVTMHAWLARGRAKESPVFIAFLKAVEQAEAAIEADMVNIILDAAKTDPTKACWYLERRRNSDYGIRMRRELTGPDGTPIQLQHSVPDADLARYQASMREELKQELSFERRAKDASGILSVSGNGDGHAGDMEEGDS